MLRGLTDDPGHELDEASAFLSTSAFEGQGLSIAEALVHGCPVVAYDVRYGPRDLLADGGGMLVPDADIDALAAALVELLTDVELRARLTAEAVAASRAVHPSTRWPRSPRRSTTCSPGPPAGSELSPFFARSAVLATHPGDRVPQVTSARSPR